MFLYDIYLHLIKIIWLQLKYNYAWLDMEQELDTLCSQEKIWQALLSKSNKQEYFMFVQWLLKTT